MDQEISEYKRSIARRKRFTMRKLSPSELGTDKEDRACIICLEPFDILNQEKFWERTHIPVRTKCKHTFGGSCLASWLRKHDLNEDQPNPKCPLCRTIIEPMTLLTDDIDMLIKAQKDCKYIAFVESGEWGIEKLQARIDLQEHYPIPLILWSSEIWAVNIQLSICLYLSPETLAYHMERAKVIMRGLAADVGITIDSRISGGDYFFNQYVLPRFVSAATVSCWPASRKISICTTLLDILQRLIIDHERESRKTNEGRWRYNQIVEFDEDNVHNKRLNCTGLVSNQTIQKLLEEMHTGILDAKLNERIAILQGIGEAAWAAYKLWKKRNTDRLNDFYSTRSWLKERLEILVKGFGDFQNGITATHRLGAERRSDMENLRVISKKLHDALRAVEERERGWSWSI
jgi:hypothetical protein